MKKILIADSGSSKTDWRLIEGEAISQFICKGLNPDFNTSEMVNNVVSETFSSIDCLTINEIHFYGSGCSSQSRNQIVEDGLKAIFKSTEINIYHDLLGAARAACGTNRGIAGILGTGSNCCLFDGVDVIEEYRTGGYIIGDEGGGVYIGKKIVKAFIEKRLPEDLMLTFNKRYQLSVDDILHKMYKEEYPNRFLASFSQFAFHHKEHPYIAQLIYQSFEDYFDYQVLRYKECHEIPLCLVGSIAFYYQEIIRKLAADKKVRIGNILEKPISGLSLYHSDLS